MNTQTKSILLAAILATPLAAFGQNRINTGSANDANNRIGSGGINEGTSNTSASGFNNNNNVVYGTVTGGREFRGSDPISAPGAFHGPAAGGLSDRFVRQSSSAYDNNAQSVKPFYGNSYGAPPPAGFVTNPTVPGTYIQQTAPIRGGGDLRLGDITNTNATMLPTAGELSLPGQVNTGDANSLVTASPIFGIRGNENQSAGTSDQPQMNVYNNFNRNTLEKRTSDKQIQDMRDELRKTMVNDNPNDTKSDATVDPNNFSAKAKLDTPFESPVTTDLGSQPLTSSLSGQAMSGDIKSEQSMTNALVPAPQQSTQYAELSKRFKGLQNTNPTDQDTNNKFAADYQKRQADTAKAAAVKNGTDPSMKPGGMPINRLPSGGASGVAGTANAGPEKTPTPDKGPDNSTVPPDTTAKLPNQSASPTPAPKAPDAGDQGPSIDASRGMKPGSPLVIHSLTDGMKDSSLKTTLTQAEDLMRNGKFTSALDSYDLAERVAPNNPMITIGRAHAELGASYYARAESDIRRGLGADSALMLAQYDLPQFLGKDRLDFVEKDLKDITTTEPKSVRAPFLLAYLKYNAGDKKMASNYLELSEKRAGNPDALYKQLRIYWDLPAADPIPDTPNLNK